MLFLPQNTKRPPPPPPPRVLAVDVDKTLYCNGAINQPLVDFCRQKKADGFFVMLWSSRGEAHARRVAEEFHVTELFDLICSKPGYVVDDQGWGWTKYTRVIPISEAKAS